MYRCGSYTPGHDVHLIQARKSREQGRGAPARVVAVEDDGTILFADGTTRWSHDPSRLRELVADQGPDVHLGALGVLRVRVPGAEVCICIADEATPCPEPAPAPESLEDLVTQVHERGGIMISGRGVLRLLDEHDDRRRQ